tara:strand:+ start:688 stop:1029 length:342 start_codon:yes stop_codon:yes gene_type:complete
MIKKILIIFFSFLILAFCNPAYSKEIQPKSIENYINRISNKFSRTYCNTVQFGISNEGAIEFAVGETNKEFKNKSLNELIDYSILKNAIVDNLEKSCGVYDFSLLSLDNLEFD